MLSIDVGIKNLACVIIDFDEYNFTPSKIIKWDVLDLTDRPICNTPLCKEIGKYIGNDDEVVCKKHAKNHLSGLKISKPCDKLKNIKKLKMAELKEYCIGCGIETIKLKKENILKKVEKYLSDTYFLDISAVRADHVDLVSIGRMLNKKMTEFVDKNEIDVVCIENQISPIANRMKTIQGMISQYFIMTSDCSIDFVSSINKLKELNLESSTYSERKKEGIILCKSKIEDYNKSWVDFFVNSKKKDDLSDCYLQGLYCIKKIRESKSKKNEFIN